MGKFKYGKNHANYAKVLFQFHYPWALLVGKQGQRQQFPNSKDVCHYKILTPLFLTIADKLIIP